MVGAANRVVALWNNNHLRCVDVCMGECSISYLFECRESGRCWVFIGVYGRGKGRQRERL